MNDIWALVQASPLDKYWEDPALTLTTLLLDENIITQLKNENPKLLEYLHQHKQQFIDQLLEYSTVMPNGSDSHDRAHKLPYISSELLALNSPLIHEEFFKEGLSERDNPNWHRLMRFLETPAAENEVLMGYFQKVLSNLYNGSKTKTTEVVSDNMSKFMRHVCSGSVGDILTNSIVLLYTPQEAVLPAREYILATIAQSLTSEPQQTKVVCAQILTKVVEKFQAFSSGDHLVSCLLNNPRIDQIYELKGSSAVNRFLVSLVRKSQQTTVNQKDQTVRLLQIPPHHKEHLTQYLRRECEQLWEWVGSEDYITNQHRVTVRKSNPKVYQLLGLAGLEIEEGRWGFVGSQLISNIWKLLVLYPYNNILQVAALKIFSNLLKKGDEAVRKIFMNRYEEYVLELADHNLSMLRPVIFKVWCEAKNYPTVTQDESVLEKFNQFVQKQLEPLLKYEVKPQVQQVRQGQKLIVDQEDSKSRAQSESHQEAQPQPQNTAQNTAAHQQPHRVQGEPQTAEQEESRSDSNWASDQAQPSQKAPPSQTSWFDEEDSKPVQPKKETSFDFFETWSQKGPQKKPQPKKDSFADFSDFF